MLPAALLRSSPVVSLPCAAGNSIQQILELGNWEIESAPSSAHSPLTSRYLSGHHLLFMSHSKFYSSLLLLIVLNAIIKPFWIFGIDRQVQNITGTAEYGTYFSLLNLSIVFGF